MNGVRIRELQSGSPLVGESFEEMLFVVDLPEPDSTLKLSGKELKRAVGVQEHTHEIGEVNNLQSELDKKFDSQGGTVSGDIRVEGDASLKSLSVDEYLEVPELKYNRVTATGGEFWITDAGVIDDVVVEADGIYLITLKSVENIPTINFEYKDILKGIFHSGNGFYSTYLEVTGILDTTHFTCVSLNDTIPQRFMTLARQGNKANKERQGSIYLDGKNKCIRVLDSVDGQNIEQRNIKVQLGDLSEISHPTFGQLEGYGALLENAYICGRLVQRNADTGEDWVVGAVSVQGEQVFRYNEEGVPEKVTITLTATEQGFSSQPSQRKWQYQSGGEWQTINDCQTLSYTLHCNSEIWGDNRTLAIRYIAQNLYYDIITITKVYDGECAYNVLVTSRSGNNFINGEIATSLKARVYKGSEDITDTLPDNAFSWLRVSTNPDGDAVWNELHQSVGSEIEIDNEDVYRKATFDCEVRIDN